MAIGDYYNLCVKFDRNGNPLPYSQKITVGTDSNGTAILATTGVTLAQRHDANTTIAVANGDFAQLQLDSTGRLKVDIGSSVTLSGITVSNEVEVKNDVGNPIPVSGNLAISNFPSSQNVVVTSSVFPTGASTSALQTTGNTSLASIDSKLTSPLTVTGTVTTNAGTNLNTSLLALESGGNLASINTKIPSNLTVTATRLLVDGSGATQPISAVSLPLPTGAATSANQTTANTILTSIDNNNQSKIERIKGASNYSRTFAYYSTSDNPTSITHTGTTALGAETVIETITYISAGTGDFRISNIIYS